MSDKTSKKREKTGKRLFSWPFGRLNLIVLLAGLAMIVIGFVFLGQGGADSVQSLTVAPILLLTGYLVLLPASILIRDRKKTGGKDVSREA
ncbi:MAG: DUF3098 domain-containing protein [bacterium]